MEKEILELGHEPKPGYRIIYLAITFIIGKLEHTNKKNNHTKTQSHIEQ